MADRPGPVEAAPHVVASQAPLRAAAGSPVTAQVTITNRASSPRVMSLTAHGLDPAWLPAPSRSPALAPGESIVADLVLLPSVGTVAARYPLAVAVQALDPVTGFATGPTALAELVLVVDAPGQIALTLDPAEARAVFGKRIRVELRNDGVLPARVDLQAQAPGSARLALPAGTHDVPPRQSVFVRGRIRPRRVRVFGHRERHAYTVTARSAGAPRHVEGVLTTRAVLGPRTALATALVAVVAVWVALGIVYIPKLADHFRSGNSTTVTAQQAAGTGSANPGSGGGGSGSGGSGGSGSGGSGGGGSGGKKSAGADASSVQLNGVVAGSSPDGVTVSLQPTSLVDEAAEGAIGVGVSPQSDSEVGMIPAEALAGRTARPAGQHRTVSTAADGAWSFPAVPKPGYYLITFAKPGFQTARYIVDSATAAATKPLNVTMSAGQGQLNGVVTGPHGRVGGATITITDGTNTITTSTDTTGDIGSWAVVGLSTPSSYLVSASTDGLGTESKLVPLAAGGTASVALTLRAGVGAITGTVRSSAGDQLGGVTVSATDGTIARTATTVTEDGLRGRYTLSGLPAPGKYTITFTAQGFLQQTVKVALRKGQSQVVSDITLFPASTTVTGTVTSDGGGSSPGPLVGAGLTLTSSDNTYKTTSGDNGAYQFDGVAPGDYVLSAQYAGLTTVYKSLTVAAGATKPIVVPSFELVTPVKALSTAGIVGFVSDGTNPSNTICPSTPGACTLTFTLRAQDGTAVPLAQDSVASAAAGPTAYTLTPSSGIEPGLYKLTIGATDAGGATKYLPVTVGVQVPLSGIASAPAVSLYPANTITGSIRLTNLVKGYTDDLSAGGAGATNCVYAVPAGSTAPDTTKPCGDGVLAASNCLITGAPGPAYAGIATDGSFDLGDLSKTGGHVAVCDGSYDIYVAIGNPWFKGPPGLVATVSVAHGVAAVLPKPIDVPEKGQLSLTLQQIPLNGSTPKPFDSVQTIGVACFDGAAKAKISPDSITTDGSSTTVVRIGGLDDGPWVCTGTVTSSTDYSVADTGTVTVSSAQNPTIGPVPAGMLFTQTLGTVFGRLTTSWSGTPTGVGGGKVSISGVTNYSGGGSNPTAETSTVQVVPASDGCFAVTPDGSMPTAASIPADCPDLAGDTAAVGTLPLIKDSATFTVDEAPTGYRTPAPLTNQPVSAGGLVTVPIDPDPVDLTGLTLQTDPATATGLSTFTVQVDSANEPPGAGTISLSVDDTTGAITWHDSLIGTDNKIAPGTYKLTATGTGYAPAAYTLFCDAGSTCDVSAKPLTIDKLGSLTVDLGTDGGAPLTDATVTLHYGSSSIDRTTTTGGPVTFDTVAPSRDLPSGQSYSIEVKAAGYQFGDSTGSSGTKIGLDCGSGATDTVDVAPGATPTCTATPKRDGAIAGKVILVYGSTATTMVPPAGTTVTATSGGTTFTAVTKADGSFRITGTSTTQGLDDNTTWALTASLSGYSDGTQSVAITDVTKDTEIDTNAGDACTGTTNLCLHVKPVTVKVTVNDDSGNPADGLTATLTGTSGYGGPYTATASGNIYTFTGVIPDDYTLSLTGDPYTSTYTPTSINVVVTATGEQDVSNAVITRGTSTVSGTVTAAQGQTGIVAGLSGATVCIVAGTSAPTPTTTTCSTSAIRGTDGNLVVQTTGGNGTFTFTTVPNTPAGDSYYLVAVPPAGYSPYVDPDGFTTDFSDPAHNDLTGFSLTPDRVLRSVTVTVTPSSASDVLTGWTATLTAPSQPSWTYSATAAKNGSGYDLVFPQVPSGCWVFSLALATDHHGTLIQTSAPTGTGLSCPTPQLAISADTSVSTAAKYTLNEYQPQVKLTLKPLALDPNATSAAVPTSVVQGGTTLYSTTLTLPAAGLNQTLPVWVSGSAHVVLAPTAPWTADNADTAVTSGSPTATAIISEQGSTVTITLDNNLNGITVSLAPASAGSGFGTPTAVSTSTVGGIKGVAVFHDIPLSDWTASATGYTDTTVTVSGATSSGTLNHTP